MRCFVYVNYDDKDNNHNEVHNEYERNTQHKWSEGRVVDKTNQNNNIFDNNDIIIIMIEIIIINIIRM